MKISPTISLFLGLTKADVAWSDFVCGDSCVPEDKCDRVENLSCDFPDATFNPK